MRHQVEDVPELMQLIQSQLPVIEAARMSVLSKSWLHAWSTIPILRLDLRSRNKMKLKDVNRVLIRYLQKNIPIETFDLTINIENQESGSDAEKWIGQVATKNSLKEIFLSIGCGKASVTLPDEILWGENVSKIRVLVLFRGIHSVRMTTSQHPVIKCVSLRELHLFGVCISEEALHDILSSCTLLEKILLLDSCKGFKNIKVKNLHRLYELQIGLDAVHSTALEISDVPNLGVFSYDLSVSRRNKPVIPFNAHSISLGSSVTQLVLHGVIMNKACVDMIEWGFPVLECLNLGMASWMLENFHFRCASIKTLSLKNCPWMLIAVQVYAPKLLSFSFEGATLPSFSFPVSSLNTIEILLLFDLPVDASFFLKMREALTLSRKCYLRIDASYHGLPLDFDIDMDNLRTRLLLPPATNVEELCFLTDCDECQWERSPFFDALFEVCHPKIVISIPDLYFQHNNHFCRLMLREVLQKKKTTTAHWSHYLKHVQTREHPHQKWKTPTTSLDLVKAIYFKLKWH